jgi:hypothetical protein
LGNGFTINPNLAVETAGQLDEHLQAKAVRRRQGPQGDRFVCGVVPAGSSPIGTVATTILVAVSITETLLSTSFAMRSKVHARVDA